MDSQDPIEPEKKKFIENHIRSVQEESTITSDYLEDVRSQKGKEKHTLIVFIKKDGNNLTTLFRKLESLISKKIMKGKCNEKPQTTCNNGMFSSYFKCRVTMAETRINAVLVEFTSVNDINPACRFSKHGVIHLGISKRSSQSKTDWFIIDHLYGSELFEGKPCIRK